MDKPKGGNTIKIKLNGEHTTFQEEPTQVEPKSDTSPRVIKINTTEVDSDVFLESAAAKEPIDESFDWIIPESSEQDIEEFKIVSHKSSKKSSLPKVVSFSSHSNKKNGRPFGSILISAAFAILIGTTIGVVMLKLVMTGPAEKTATSTLPTTVTEEKKDPDTKASTGTAAAIGPLSVNVIQGGLFTSKDGAKEVSTQLQAKGLPSQIFEIDGKYLIFLGIADSIETAKSLSTQYKNNGAEGAFAKPLVINEKKVSTLTDKEKTFLESVPNIYQTLSLATSSALVTKAIPEEATKAMKEIEAQLKDNSVKNEQVKKIKTELTSADEKVKEYQKSKAAKSITQAQQHLLNFLALYNAL